jgi:hypothetical protein
MAHASKSFGMKNHGLPENYCLPELVPDFRFLGRSQHQLLVGWLDALCATGRGAMPCNLLEDPKTLSVDAFELECDISAQHDLICAKLVTGWLLQRIRSECETIPSALHSIDASLARRLGCGIGGCGNISWLYNWRHPLMQPGSKYEYRSLLRCFDVKDPALRPRFVPIGGEVAVSFEPFIMVHIEMEARACAMVEKTMEAQQLIVRGQPAGAEMAQVAARGRDMMQVFTACFNDGRVQPQHWGAIQNTLKFPEYTGMSSAQNMSVQLLGEVVGVGKPGHEYNQRLHDIAEIGFVPHQREVLKFFRERRNILRDFAISTKASSDEHASYNALVYVSVMWRGSHRKHVMKYVSAAVEEDGAQYRTSTGHVLDMQDLGKMFESRMQDYSSLELQSKL